MGTEGSSLDLDLLAASLRADSDEVGTFIEGLATKLEDILPGRVRCERGRRGLFGPKVLRRISVDTDSERLELLLDDADHVQAKRARVSAGIVLKTESLDTEAWLQALSEALTEEAGRNERTRQALERLMTG